MEDRNTPLKKYEYMENGVLHREDGPAIEYANGKNLGIYVADDIHKKNFCLILLITAELAVHVHYKR